MLDDSFSLDNAQTTPTFLDQKAINIVKVSLEDISAFLRAVPGLRPRRSS